MEGLKLEDITLENKSVIKEKSHLYYAVKRLMDIIGALVGIIIFSPFMLIIAVMIRIDSKGPIIFGHKRIGKNGKEIKVYKFRSMIQNAEIVLKELPLEKKIEFEKNFKFEDDPRVTKIGKILRETSLDELPQFFNVLSGKMSIVGPRPIVKEEISKYGIYAEKLFSIKPGVTGNWQANGRSNTSYEQRIQFDMEYIDRRNLWMDIKIILKTFIIVFKKEGAK